MQFGVSGGEGLFEGRVLDVEFGDFGFVALRLDVELFP